MGNSGVGVGGQQRGRGGVGAIVGGGGGKQW